MVHGHGWVDGCVGKEEGRDGTAQGSGHAKEEHSACSGGCLFGGCLGGWVTG